MLHYQRRLQATRCSNGLVNSCIAKGKDQKLDLQLVHGGKLLNDDFQNLRISDIYDSESGGEIRAAEMVYG